MALESAWELYLPTLGPEGRYPGSASPTQAGKGGPSMMLTPPPPGTNRAMGQRGGR